MVMTTIIWSIKYGFAAEILGDKFDELGQSNA